MKDGDRQHRAACAATDALLTQPITTIAEHMSVLWGRSDARRDEAYLRDLVDRLAVHDVTYLSGGSDDAGHISPYTGPHDAPLPTLIRDLAEVPNGRLRDALIALLLRHPDYAASVRDVCAALPRDSSSKRALTARLLAAAALQKVGGARLTADGLLPAPIDVSGLVAGLGLPAPDVEDGAALLQAAAALLAGPLPVDWVGGWHDVLSHVLREVERSRQSATAGY